MGMCDLEHTCILIYNNLFLSNFIFLIITQDFTNGYKENTIHIIKKSRFKEAQKA